MKSCHFKPGDRVRILKDMPFFDLKKGDVGTVDDPLLPWDLIPEGTVMVNFKSEGPCQGGKIRFTASVNVSECDLAPADNDESACCKPEEKAAKASVRHIVFDISDDGGEASYIDGKKTLRKAKVKRSYKDEPNDFNAMMYLIAKMFPESNMYIGTPDRDHDGDVEEDYPDIEGWVRFRSPGCSPLYIDVNQIVSVEYKRDEYGERYVCIHTAEGGYDVYGYSMGEAMKKIEEARCW